MKKGGCGRAQADIFFDVCVPVKYKMRLLKAQALKRCRTFVIQKSYGVRAFPLSQIGLKLVI